MCGRYATTRSAADLSALFDALDETDGQLVADYNVAPTDPVPIVRRSRRVPGQVLSVARWGLAPAWAAEPGPNPRMINARAETVATAKAYATSFARRRCLVPADGWYEWRRLSPRQKQPYFLTASDGAVLAFAGLWSVCGNGGQPLLTCSVVTTAAVGEFALVHDRMPLILPPQRWAQWLGDAAEPFAEPSGLLTPPTAEYLATLELRPVSAAVGDVRNDGPELLRRVPAAPLTGPADVRVDLTLF